MIVQWVTQLGPWSWVLLGLILLALEIIVPGNIFVWFGVAGILTGLLAFVTDFGWQGDLIVFVLLALVLVIVGRRVFARSAQPGERPFLNDRAHQLVGNAYVLSAPIVDGRGSVHIDDTTWRVTGQC
jgi:membrane protein implicated in regulation of membrane protease activity